MGRDFAAGNGLGLGPRRRGARLGVVPPRSYTDTAPDTCKTRPFDFIEPSGVVWGLGAKSWRRRRRTFDQGLRLA